jgi:hypothetical protein
VDKRALERDKIARLIKKGLANTRKGIMAYEKYVTDANIKRQKIRRSKHKYKTTEYIQKQFKSIKCALRSQDELST